MAVSLAGGSTERSPERSRRRLAEVFDPQVVADYGITADDLRRVERYLRLLQGADALSLKDIAVGGYYGTSALLHEVVELRMLLARDRRLLRKSPARVKQFFLDNPDAHAHALAVEHIYLRQVIARLFEQDVAIGALILANAGRRDFCVLAESDVPVPLFEPVDEEVVQAATCLLRLRQLGRRML